MTGPGGGRLVLWLVSEAFPWANTGGLGDVAGSLPAVLRSRGWDVRVVMPFYGITAVKGSFSPAFLPVSVPVWGSRRFAVRVRESMQPAGSVPFYFIESVLFDRPGVYGDGTHIYEDNPLRYGIFQLAALQLAASLRPRPAILHCHDWHTGMVPGILRWPGAELVPELRDTRTILTIHNMEFQGHSERRVFDELQLPYDMWHPDWGEHWGGLNFLKAGLLSADRVNTVSPSYAREIRTPERGMGMEGTIRLRGDDVIGIVNGIDNLSWDPATDPLLDTRYDVDHLEGRETCRVALRTELRLAPGEPRPLLGFVGRVTKTKGVDLLLKVIPRIVELGCDLVVLGNGERELEEGLVEAERAHPGRVRFLAPYDWRIARRIHSGGDIVVMPSKNEPCGLVQLYALRYGGIPLVHAVGGLRDTVQDGVTGFRFDEPTPDAFITGLQRALDAFRDQPRWRDMQRRGMKQDWSWARSAQGYDALYDGVLSVPPRRRGMPGPWPHI